MGTFAKKTADDLNWSALLGHLSKRCSTPLGEERATQLGLLDDEELIADRLAEVEEARRLLENGDRPPFEGFEDLRRSLDRAARQAVLEPEELVSIARTLGAVRRLAAFFSERRETAPRLARRALSPSTEGRRRLRDLEELLASCFEEDGRLSDRASPELASLRARERALRERLSRTIEQLLDKYEDVLQDRYFTIRDDRYVLPIRTDAHRKVHGIVHGHSNSEQTIYIEPREITALGNELMILRSEIAREEQRVLAELSEEVRRHVDELDEVLENDAVVDLRVAAGRLAVDLGGAVPRIGEEGRLSLVAVRHPLMVLEGARVVPNDIELRPGHVLVVSGPNGGGKTVALKTVGLALLMLRAGLPIAADGASVVPLVRQVFTDMGDDQSLEESLSTFAAHMSNIARILRSAEPGDVVLLDELAGGTDPTEGAALATEIALALAGRGAAVMISTHYTQLKVAALQLPQFSGASFGFDRDDLRPTYRLSRGAPGVSGALAAARRYGLPAEVVEAARQRLGEDTHRITTLMEELEAQRRQLQSEAEKLQAERKKLEGARRAVEHERQRVIRRRRDQIQREIETLQAELRRARETVREVQERLKSKKRRRRITESAVKRATEELDKVGRSLAPGGTLAKAVEPEPPPGRAASMESLQPGVRVWVPSMGGEGEVVERPSRKKVRVAFGRVTMTVDVEGLRILDGKKEHGTSQLRPPSIDAAADPEVPAMTSQNTLDLRGERVDDALREADKFLDKALQKGWQVAFFIHGHGTGALKKALRRHFEESPWVERFQGGERHQGGDGVTVVWLK